jgi:hypothetical protein
MLMHKKKPNGEFYEAGGNLSLLALINTGTTYGNKEFQKGIDEYDRKKLIEEVKNEKYPDEEKILKNNQTIIENNFKMYELIKKECYESTTNKEMVAKLEEIKTKIKGDYIKELERNEKVGALNKRLVTLVKIKNAITKLSK